LIFSSLGLIASSNAKSFLLLFIFALEVVFYFSYLFQSKLRSLLLVLKDLLFTSKSVYLDIRSHLRACFEQFLKQLNQWKYSMEELQVFSSIYQVTIRVFQLSYIVFLSQ